MKRNLEAAAETGEEEDKIQWKQRRSKTAQNFKAAAETGEEGKIQ